MLQRAVRNKEVEPDEFKCSIAHNSLVKGEEFDDLRAIIDGDDNSEDEDHGNLVEIEYDFDSSDNEDLEHINRRSTKSLDKNIVKQKAIPDIVLIRHALKILSNVMNIPMGIKDEHQMAYHEHLSTELSEIMVGDSSTTQGIPLTKIAKKDEYINFYYSMLSN